MQRVQLVPGLWHAKLMFINAKVHGHTLARKSSLQPAPTLEMKKPLACLFQLAFLANAG